MPDRPELRLHEQLTKLREVVCRGLAAYEELAGLRDREAAEEPPALNAFLRCSQHDDDSVQFESIASMDNDRRRRALEFELSRQIKPLWDEISSLAERLGANGELSGEVATLLRHAEGCLATTRRHARGIQIKSVLEELNCALLTLPKHSDRQPLEPVPRTRAEIAGALGVTPDTVRGWVRRQNDPLQQIGSRGRQPLYDLRQAQRIHQERPTGGHAD